MLNSKEVAEFIIDKNKYSKLAQVGVDLTLHSVKIIKPSELGILKLSEDKSKIRLPNLIEIPCIQDDDGAEIYVLKEGIYSITYDQGCKLPNNVSALIIGRSTVLRGANKIESAVHDPGFEVEQMGSMFFVNNPIMIERHSRVAQIIMFKCTPTENYNGNYQKEKDFK